MVLQGCSSDAAHKSENSCPALELLRLKQWKSLNAHCQCIADTHNQLPVSSKISCLCHGHQELGYSLFPFIFLKKLSVDLLLALWEDTVSCSSRGNVGKGERQ